MHKYLQNKRDRILRLMDESDIRDFVLGISLIVMLVTWPHKSVAGIDFLSIAENATIMYDAPSVKSGKLFVASSNLPVEAVVNVEGWAKVRDSSGGLAWVEKKALSEQRFVIVTVPVADIFQLADETSELVFQAQKSVVMEWLNSDIPGWIKVRHRDGQSGYIKTNQVWGA
ncbi:SH3 domain-containing protein [Nitrosomonas aestuarii]|nr:SH3 domain-containing protein [Nitrosomonas aestuarii]